MKAKTLLAECGGRLRVLALTAIRSEYDLLYPVLHAMRRDPHFEPSIIVAGAHLTRLHRRSVRLIEADGFRIAGRIANLRLGRSANTPAGRVAAAARLLSGLSQVLRQERPDLLLCLGDREEPLMAAIVGNYMGVPTVHLAGGDNAHPRGGDVDEEARHATTKLSHIHLTMAAAHSERIVRMGEERWRVRTVGNPGLDRFRTEPSIPLNDLCRLVGSAVSREYVVVIYHAVSSETHNATSELALCLSECLAAGLEVFVGAPNSDPGFAGLQRVIRRFARRPRVTVYDNLPRSEFVTLIRRARAIVGNSSLGLLEASFVGVPCVNVGERQRGRLAGVNVQFVDAKAPQLRRAIAKALFDERYRTRVRRATSPYGNGRTAVKVTSFLKTLPPKRTLLAKRITY